MWQGINADRSPCSGNFFVHLHSDGWVPDRPPGGQQAAGGLVGVSPWPGQAWCRTRVSFHPACTVQVSDGLYLDSLVSQPSAEHSRGGLVLSGTCPGVSGTARLVCSCGVLSYDAMVFASISPHRDAHGPAGFLAGVAAMTTRDRSCRRFLRPGSGAEGRALHPAQSASFSRTGLK